MSRDRQITRNSSRTKMCGKILIFALLGCSLVLASPIQENNEEYKNGKSEIVQRSVKSWGESFLDTLKSGFERATKPIKNAFNSVVNSGKSLFQKGKVEEPVTTKTIIEPPKRPKYSCKKMKEMKAKAKILNEVKIDKVDHELFADDVAEETKLQVGQSTDTVRNEATVAVEQQKPNGGFFGKVGEKIGGHVGGAVDKLVHAVGNVGGHVGNAVNNVKHVVGKVGDMFNNAKDFVGDRVKQVKDFGGKVHGALTLLGNVGNFIG